MVCTLNKDAYERLIDEDLAWLREQPRTLERDHIEQCLQWLRTHKPDRLKNLELELEHVRSALIEWQRAENAYAVQPATEMYGRYSEACAELDKIAKRYHNRDSTRKT
jgi:hypothetical protein